MAHVIIYTTSYCPYCTGAKAFLRSKNVKFEEIDVTATRNAVKRWRDCPSNVPCRKFSSTVRPIGGYDDARRLDAKGELDVLLGVSENTAG